MAGSDMFSVVTVIGNALKDLTPDEQQQALDGVTILLGLRRQPVPAQAPSASTSSRSLGDKPMSVVEYVKLKKPTSNAQMITAFAGYRQDVERLDRFSAKDLQPYFERAKLPAPGRNYMRDYNKAVKQGWIEDNGAASYITQGGEEALATGFAGKQDLRGKPNQGKGSVER